MIKKIRKPFLFVPFITSFAVIGIVTLLLTNAATPSLSIEPENDTLSSTCVTAISDSAASGGGGVTFGGTGCGVTVTDPGPGAHLPISYDLASLTGTVRYVATNGSDSASGTLAAPYATVTKAITASAANDTVVIRGGTYRQGTLSTSSSKPIKMIAYPGEIPVFNGARAVAGGWTTEGSYKYIAYTPRPASDGSGISFTTGENLNGDGVGKYPDQAWIASTQLQQVSAKTSLATNKFWVDTTNSRLYLLATDADKGSVEVSQTSRFLKVTSPNTTIEGLQITRFSNGASDYGVVQFSNTADNSVMRNVEISDSAFMAVLYGGDSNQIDNALLQHVTLESSGWMGIDASYTNNLTLDSVKITDMNTFKEFSNSPQSGALKTSRTRGTKVVDSDISSNHSHALWFDQSNVGVDVANNQIVDNEGAGVFFEISDGLLLINNYIKAPASYQTAKLSGSSGLKLVNNTFVGGNEPIGIYTDSRSVAGCADPAQPLCADSYNSDRDTVRTRPATLDWMPRLDLMINNIIAYPTGTSFCSSTKTALCVLTNHSSGATAPIQTIIHKVDTQRGLPQTQIDSNVYANDGFRLINISSPSAGYTALSAFTTAMAGSPVSISGLEANGRAGNTWVNADGSPTAALAAVHNQATPIPTDANINLYIPVGTRHYGVTTK